MIKMIFGLLKLSVLAVILGLIFHNFTTRLLLTGFLRYSLGAPVEIRDARVDLLNTQIVFKDIEIRNPDGFPPGTLAYIPEMFVDSEISSLWEGHLHVETVEVNLSELRLARLPDGRLNMLALKIFKDSGKQAAAVSPRRERSGSVDVDNFILSLGRASYIDYGQSSPKEHRVELGLRRMTYWNVRTLRDILEIVSWESLKPMGLQAMGNGLLDRIGQDLDGKQPREGFLARVLAGH